MSKEELRNILEKLGCKVNPSWNEETLRYIIDQKNKLLIEEKKLYSIDYKSFLNTFITFISRTFFVILIGFIIKSFFN